MSPQEFIWIFLLSSAAIHMSSSQQYGIPSKPTLDVGPENIIFNCPLHLDCHSTSTSLPVAYRPAMLYTWKRNGDVIDMESPPERHAVAGDSGETLVISPVHPTDHQATYTCTASENGTQLSSPDSDDVILEVLYGPVALATDSRNPSAVEDSTLVITATAECSPNCNFMWWRGSDVISDSAVLKLQQIQLDDAGIYTVTAYNAYWDLTLDVEVTVVPEDIPVTTEDPNPGSNGSPDDDTADGNVVLIAVTTSVGVVAIATVFIVAVILCKRLKGGKGGSQGNHVYENAAVMLGETGEQQPGYPVTGGSVTVSYHNSEESNDNGGLGAHNVCEMPETNTGYMHTNGRNTPRVVKNENAAAKVYENQMTAAIVYENIPPTTNVNEVLSPTTPEYVNIEVARTPPGANAGSSDAVGRVYEQIDPQTSETQIYTPLS